MFLDCYAIHDNGPEIRPGNSKREWMDNSPDRFAYRCLPLTMANATGWEILCPFDFVADWNGGPENSDITIVSPTHGLNVDSFVTPHFKNGILTFHTGYLFRTPAGVELWCMGPPNQFKDGISPLSGLVETDWLPFPFTMNWQFTRPGKVVFRKGEAFCFFTMVEPAKLEAVQPEIKSLSSNEELAEDYKVWSHSRGDFIKRLNEREGDAVKEGWQRHYMTGKTPRGGEAPDKHVTKRRLKMPKDTRKDT